MTAILQAFLSKVSKIPANLPLWRKLKDPRFKTSAGLLQCKQGRERAFSRRHVTLKGVFSKELWPLVYAWYGSALQLG
jgi:hypothetical protein